MTWAAARQALLPEGVQTLSQSGLIRTSTTEVAASGTSITNVLTFTVPANYAREGQIWHAVMWGIADQPSDATPAFFRAYPTFNAFALSTEFKGDASLAVSGRQWQTEAYFAVGASGFVREHVWAVHELTTTNIPQFGMMGETSSTQTLSAAWNFKLDIQKTETGGTPAYDMKCRGAFVEVLNPYG